MNNDQEVGYVLSSRNYIAYMDGLPTIKINDIVQSDSGIRGVVNTLLPSFAEVLLLDEGAISPGACFKKTGQNLSLAVGDFLLGRAINALGVPIDGKTSLATANRTTTPLERKARGIDEREFITEQFITGITLVDSLVPIGRGQRELIIGDAHAGIPNFLIDVVVNQKKSSDVRRQTSDKKDLKAGTSGTLVSEANLKTDSSVICIYAAIGKSSTFIKNLINTFKVNGALDHTIIVASSSTEPAPMILLTPKTAFSIAEYFQEQGKDVLVILDDMGIHAKTYRELSLLANKTPGRESYPGDIFYTQARLLERAGRFKTGTITALPVIELNLTDFTGFIPTNLIAITDGHMLFRSNLYNKNARPAIDVPFSVTRVGRQTQPIVDSLLSRRVRQTIEQATSLATLGRFSGELPPETQLILRQFGMIEEILRQEDLVFVPPPTQTALLGLIFTSFLKDKDAVFFKKHKDKLIGFFSQNPLQEFKTDAELIAYLDNLKVRLEELCK